MNQHAVFIYKPLRYALTWRISYERNCGLLPARFVTMYEAGSRHVALRCKQSLSRK
jgi:hypothetical protein